jgi:hypothetical protein
MNSIKLLAAVGAFGFLATPAMAQTTNTMGSMSSGSMEKPMDKGMSSKTHMMPMNHMGMSKKTMAACHKMSHSRMMKSHQCRGMMKHGKMMNHAM